MRTVILLKSSNIHTSPSSRKWLREKSIHPVALILGFMGLVPSQIVLQVVGTSSHINVILASVAVCTAVVALHDNYEVRDAELHGPGFSCPEGSLSVDFGN
nr:uncharacterized protein LOC112274820 [Physcomitrium patens]|eukprot:XP_024360362.1 uncharacterized protein LOC112274820 [Physcomitrella patens]